MRIGSMNHPAHDPVAEITWMAEMELEFVDLTLEPPRAMAAKVDVSAIRGALSKYRLPVVGHTAYYLPIASPFETIRRAAMEELTSCVTAFAAIGAEWMNIHPDSHTPMHPRQFCIERNLISLRELLSVGQRHGVGIMIENLPGEFNSPAQLADLLDPLPELGLHLDIAHANLHTPYNMTESILERFGHRLKHVHLHDNKGGGADLHMPLGTGTVDVSSAVRALKNAEYDGTITLEVFTPDRQYLRYSRDLLRRIWDGEAR